MCGWRRRFRREKGGRGRRAKSRLVKEDEIGRSGSGKTKDIERGEREERRSKLLGKTQTGHSREGKRKEGRRGRREEEEGRKEGKKRETIEVGMPNNGE